MSIAITILCWVLAGFSGFFASKAEQCGKPWGLATMFCAMAWGLCVGVLMPRFPL